MIQRPFWVVLLLHVQTVYSIEFILELLSGDCSSDTDERCGFLELGYIIHSSNDSQRTCSPRCSYWPLLELNYVCESCPADTATPTTGFLIDLDLTDSVSSGTDRALFRSARDTWESIVVGDLPSVPSSELTLTADPGCSYPETIDDLHVCCLYEEIDGPSKILGLANWRERRPDGLPMTGRIRLDSEDTERLIDLDRLQTLIEHEMAHVLGIGLLWDDLQLIEQNGSDDWEYVGEQAVTRFRDISGCDTIPVESNGLHWSENCLRNELLTSDIVDNNNQLSTITVASLADMGYEVNYGPADTFTLFNINPDCWCTRRTFQRRIQTDEGSSRPQLSEEGLQNAIRYGRQVLAEDGSVRSNSGLVNNAVSVFYEENGTIFGVTVQ